MKKIFFLTIIIIYSISVKGQQTVINDGVSIVLPNGTQKITKEYALDHAGKKFPNNKLAKYSYHDVHTTYMYKIDDIILILFPFDRTFNFAHTHIIEIKKGLDELESNDKSYISYMIKVNNNSVIVTRNTVQDLEYYSFYCYNDNNTRVLNGTLEFKIDEEDEATSVLNDLLGSIRFKD